MPIAAFDEPHYLNRWRVFLSSEDRSNLAEADSLFNARFDLGQYRGLLLGVELIGHNIPRSFSPTFVADRLDGVTVIPGNIMLDIEITNGVQTLVFAATLNEGVFGAVAPMAAMITAAINTAMDATGDVNFTSALTPFSVTVANAGEMARLLVANGGGGAIVFTLLFGTGANADRSPVEVMGYGSGADAVSALVGGTPVSFSTGYVNLSPFRWVDVMLPQFQEHRPTARIMLACNDSADFGKPTTNDDTRHGLRLLKDNPTSKLSELRVRLDFDRGVRPLPEYTQQDWDLTFELTILTPDLDVPGWLQQSIAPA